MAKFLGIIRGGTDKLAKLSPADMEAHMQQWYTWIESLKDTYVGGDPLQNDRKILRGDNGNIVFDGPFTEVKEIVGGYIILNASSLDEATEIAKGCPVLEVDGSIEMAEFAPM